MTYQSHLNALQLHLSNERIRLTNAKTEAERALRKVWIAQLEKEIADEEDFLGIDISDDELLAALQS